MEKGTGEVHEAFSCSSSLQNEQEPMFLFFLELIKFLKKEVLCASLCSGQHLHPEEEGGEGRCAHLTAGKAGAGRRPGAGLGLGFGQVWPR